MKRFLPLLLVVLTCVSTAQALCFTGHVSKYNAQNIAYDAPTFNVKWCKADPNTFVPTGQCSYGTTTAQGFYTVDVTTWGAGDYFPYAWKDSDYWGSESYPLTDHIRASTAACNTVNLYTPPRTLPSNAVTPAYGAVNFGVGTFTLQWSDGLDVERRRSDWPVTYDIWAAGNDAQMIKEFENVPCNGVGTCSLSGVSGLTYTMRYKWRVVGRIKDSAVIQGAGDNTYYQNSLDLPFSTQWDPTIQLYNITTFNGNYLRAVGGGGPSYSTVDVGGGSSNYETQFQVISGRPYGMLYSGDQVQIHTNRNYFVGATNGGGAGVSADPCFCTYETWTITRIAGFGPIYPGDQVAFSIGGLYMSAEYGGGGTVYANRRDIGPWETFVLANTSP